MQKKTFKSRIIKLKDVAKMQTKILCFIECLMKCLIFELMGKILSVSDGQTYLQTDTVNSSLFKINVFSHEQYECSYPSTIIFSSCTTHKHDNNGHSVMIKERKTRRSPSIHIWQNLHKTDTSQPVPGSRC